MSRTVVCSKLKKELPGLERAPYPGPKGQHIFDHVSAEAWALWQTHQTRLINEKQLVMTDPEARIYLMDQMDKFLNDQPVDAIEGYVPEK